MSGPAPSLVSVRRELEEIDRAIVLLVAARVEAACSAIRLRSGNGGSISDPVQEERVLARARQWAQEAGLSPVLTETIFRAVMGAGKERFATGAGRAGLAVSAPRRRRSARTRGSPTPASEAERVPRPRAPTLP